MKANLLNIAATAFTAPIIATGYAVAGVGVGMIETGRALVTAGEYTYHAGEAVKAKGHSKKGELKHAAKIAAMEAHGVRLQKLQAQAQQEVEALKGLGLVIDV